jgi:uncharacterized protein (DUF885 family)
MHTTRLLLALGAAALMTLPATATPAAPRKARSPEAQRLHALFAEAWEDGARRFPEWATYRGDHRYGDKLRDRSPAAIAAGRALNKRYEQRLRAIPRDRLSAQDRVSYDMFLRDLLEDQELDRFEGFRTLSIGSLWGFHTSLANLMRQSPARSERDLRNILARYAAFPRRVDQELAQLERGLQLGWVSSRPVLERALQQLDTQLNADPTRSPFYEPFARSGKDLPEPALAALQAEAQAALRSQVYPAMQKLAGFLRERYLPQAPQDGAYQHYPQGREVYAALVRQHTTSTLGPDEVHEIGLAQVKRLRAEMEAVREQAGFQGTLAAFVQAIKDDPAQYYPDGESLLAGYREIAKRVDPELPRLFAELPRAPYGIRAMPAYMGPGAAENYSGPEMGGRSAGWFNANALAFKRKPKWAMETLVAHEAMPGHHLQIARAGELGALPEFRRRAFITAYTEGWALYAETLGGELGLYQTPYSRFGHLQGQMLRATRLVVDTGLHAKGWTRQQAIDYMVEQGGEDPVFIASEVDRYYSNPGQALAYMMGKLRIEALRDRARQALGERFALRDFHMVVLDQGPVPLDVLERRVDEWIGEQRKAAAVKG